MITPEAPNHTGVIDRLDQLFETKLLSGEVVLGEEGDTEEMSATNDFGQPLKISRPTLDSDYGQNKYNLRYVIEVNAPLEDGGPSYDFVIPICEGKKPRLFTDAGHCIGYIENDVLELHLAGVVG